MGKKFILNTDWFAKKIIDPNNDSRPLSRNSAFNKEVQLVKGSMLEELGSEKLNTGVLNLRCIDQDNVRVVCPENVLIEVSLFQAEVLVAVSPVQDRLKVVDDKMWLREAAMIVVGCHVYIDVDEEQPALGVVRYTGPIAEIGKGILFGVELVERPELGNCDGSVKFKHYFNTRSKNALIVGINKLRLLQERRSLNPCSITPREGSPFEAKIGLSTPESSVPPPTPRLQPISYEKACTDGAAHPPLRINDKVVWISDSGPEYGIVKWLGKLPDVGTDWMVGVEFDNPVGSGTGKYNELQLFEAKLNHASLVPIIGLMKAEDFLGDKSIAATPNGTPPRPSRKKKTSTDHQEITVHSGPSLQPTYSSLPRDFHNKSDYSNVSPHGTIQRKATPPPSSSHTRSHSASLVSGFENLGITSLYSTIDKPKNASSSHRDKMSNHGISDNLVASNHLSKSGNPLLSERIGNSKDNETIPGLTCKLGLAGGSSESRLDMATDGSSILPPNQFYFVGHDDCLQKPMTKNTTVNPLYEISNRKNNSLKMGTTRLDESGDPSSNQLIGSATISNMCGHSSKKLNLPMSNGTTMTNNNNNNLSNHVLGAQCELEVGSVVEVSINGEPCYGVIRWIGIIPEEQNSNKLVAGIEMEEENQGCTDGMFHGRRYFTCPLKKAFFVRLSQCRKDGRFLDSEKRKSAVFGSIDCPSVSGDIPPLGNLDRMRQLCGKNRGIQGHHNSCYLDATLFAMFSCTNVLDSLLHRPASADDIAEYGQVQRVLKEEIVNPLRANLYVRADRVMKLRTLLDKLSSVSGLMSEEKDPEEFLNSLLNQILKADPFLKLSSGQEAYFYQLFVEKDEKLVLPTVQQLFDQSFLASDIKLREIPPCLLIQMPRFGKQFKMYPRIIPSLYLDITDVLDDSPRQCSVCGQVAEFECKECFEQLGTGLDSTAFCHICIEKSHSHKKRSKHKCTPLNVPSEFRMLKDHVVTIPRVYMELFAVLCIETSHYVSFVKYGSGPDAPWVFFDSMADRKGEQNGYNIPEVLSFPDLKWYLSDEGIEFLTNTKDDRLVPEIPRRLLCDAYMCLYQSPEVMMYR